MVRRRRIDYTWPVAALTTGNEARIAISAYPLHSTPPLRRCPSEYRHAVWYWKTLEWCGYPAVKKIRRYVYSFWQNPRTRQTHGQTHRHTDTAWRLRVRLMLVASRGKNDGGSPPVRNCLEPLLTSSFRAYSAGALLCPVHNMWPFVSSSGLSPGSREAEVQRAKVCLNCTEPSVVRSSCWSLPVGRYLSDTHCKGSTVVLARWTASNMAEEPQTSSDFRIWHTASIRYPQDLA